ncbi:flagellar hook-basal body protein [Solirubrobacter sp. CPCC 204708]|uniref:Flagellar hook-basal body protein n=1 Tax=Solirubrobacter deserti TaxID=2282478 RepID=A0ABT4RNB1_9ACTN|nr:flagellar hook-basal body protein [Solirubrobacter deserti]MBE2316949.1 flagellar hook-basal body protein [Solirubrobacter deserti]MDA0139780.1 flagellar hook-basal body protein [Solirubrobacter deserti]
MLEGLRTAAAGMKAQQFKLDAVSNDLANANTTGYKRLRVGFSDLLYEQGGRPTISNEAQLGTGSRAVQGGRTFEQGNLQRTEKPTDVALQGPGFMKVKLSDGRDALTRDGNFQIDANRRLVTSSGGFVTPTITIPEGVDESEISIGRDGQVLAKGQAVGRIQLVNVRSPQNLESVGENAFVTTARSGNAVAAPATTVLEQGALEGSNTDMAQAMTDMIEAQRTYQLTSKAIQTADQMMEVANGVKR